MQLYLLFYSILIDRSQRKGFIIGPTHGSNHNGRYYDKYFQYYVHASDDNRNGVDNLFVFVGIIANFWQR